MKTNPLRPISYKDWRSLWHAEAKALGWHISYTFKIWGRLIMDKDTWKYLHRLRRIRNRLDVESEVRDNSWCEALIELLIAYNVAKKDS
jgi:hypothetical protein